MWGIVGGRGWQCSGLCDILSRLTSFQLACRTYKRPGKLWNENILAYFLAQYVANLGCTRPLGCSQLINHQI